VHVLALALGVSQHAQRIASLVIEAMQQLLDTYGIRKISGGETEIEKNNQTKPKNIHDTIQYNTIQYNTIQYNTIQYNTIQYNTIQYEMEPKTYTIQYNTIQYNTKTNYTFAFATIHEPLDVRPRQPSECVEAERRVLYKHRTVKERRRLNGFQSRDLLRGFLIFLSRYGLEEQEIKRA
jgi:hypothetical protein